MNKINYGLIGILIGVIVLAFLKEFNLLNRVVKNVFISPMEQTAIVISLFSLGIAFYTLTRDKPKLSISHFINKGILYGTMSYLYYLIAVLTEVTGKTIDKFNFKKNHLIRYFWCL